MTRHSYENLRRLPRRKWQKIVCVEKVMGSFLTDNTPLEITVLKPADSLTRVVKDQMEPFYLREKTLET